MTTVGQPLVLPTGHAALTAAGNLAIFGEGDKVLWDSGGDKVLWDSGGDVVLWEAYQCDCCGGDCGECNAPISGDVTLDLGAPGWTGFDENYNDNCETPCVDLTGELTLSQSEDCLWLLLYDPFCTKSSATDPDDKYFRVYFRLSIVEVSGVWTWRLQCVGVFVELLGGTYTAYEIRRVEYEAATGTSCSGSKTLTKTVDTWPAEDLDPGFDRVTPCVSTSPDWDWPTTVDIDVP